MTTTETRPGALATARHERDLAQCRIDELHLAVDHAHRGGATVMRLDTIRSILGPTAGEQGGAR